RKCFRTTSFRPDHSLVTAHTFTSTRSVLSAQVRIRSSVTSVGIFADFLYQETQIAPSTGIAARALTSSRSSSDIEVTKRCTMSQHDFDAFATTRAPCGSGFNHSVYSFGALILRICESALIPSLFASVVAE